MADAERAKWQPIVAYRERLRDSFAIATAYAQRPSSTRFPTVVLRESGHSLTRQPQRPEASPSQPQGHGRVAFLPLVRFRLKCPRPKAYCENPQTLGEHVKKRRLELGLTQKQAAKVLSVNSWTVLNWETRRVEPPICWMPAILRFLGYDPFPPPTTVGERLLQARREHDWSTTEAARQLGVDRTTWQDWERGELILFRKHRINVATLLGLDPKKWPTKCGLAGMESIGGGNATNPDEDALAKRQTA